MDLTSLKSIYKEVLRETNAVLNALEAQSEDVELSKAIETARKNVTPLKKQTDAILQELDKNAEWDVFTVAFYGETNAGKSTIIETLRILMGENKKQEARRKFREMREKFNIDENAADKWNQKSQEIARYEEKLQIFISQFNVLQKKQNAHEQQLTLRVDQLTTEIKFLPFWRHILSFVWKMPAKAELIAVKTELNQLIAENQQIIKEHEQQKLQIISEINSTNNEIADIVSAINKLKSCQDGDIIGDGQSDFTRKTSSYEFTANKNYKFVLLDVPGIEGKEELVREPIMQALQKAHAVFYVTRKADPPQKGDNKPKEKGTLEKIKEHLGAQTQVWTIFNKSIKSAEQLRMPQLVNKGELDSLKVLDAEMKQQLGKHYVSSLIVSAYPAFIASTDHFIPGNIKGKDRSKFLAVMKSDDILHKTGFISLTHKLGEMLENVKMRIRKSNFNKANDVIRQLAENIRDLNKITFNPLLDKLESQAHDSILQLESAVDELDSNIESAVMSVFRKKREKSRRTIYEKINQDISNNNFKHCLEYCIQYEFKGIENELSEEIKKQCETFQEEVKDIAAQFQEHVQEFLDDAFTISDTDFEFEIKIDNGISVAGLITTVLGLMALIFVSSGWALAFGAFSITLSFTKAVWAFFDSDYKKAQQRKAADKNIEKIFCSVESTCTSQLKEKKQELYSNLGSIKNKFQLPAIQAQKITSLLNDFVQRLELISRKIITEGNL
jgi:hypothetical protein